MSVRLSRAHRLGARVAIIVAVVAVSLAAPFGAAAQSRKALKVCADPNYPPFSTDKRDGFENKLADLLAAELGLPVEYTWFPARLGFIRNTLRAEDPSGEGYKCDVVMGVPDGYELTITTKPYYTSTYTLVYVKGGKLDDIHSGPDLIALDDARKSDLRIGMNERDPGTMWMAKYGMFEQIEPYVAQGGDPAEYPGQAIGEDLIAGKIDAAVLWGPLAAQVKRAHPQTDIVMIPLFSEPGVRFHFSMSMGVRHPDDEWRDQLDEFLARNRDKIQALLREYMVPLVAPDGSRLES